jgi:hypothetical protein
MLQASNFSRGEAVIDWVVAEPLTPTVEWVSHLAGEKDACLLDAAELQARG